MSDIRVLLTDLAFPESPRWHDGRVYVSDWGAGDVHAVTTDGSDEVLFPNGMATIGDVLVVAESYRHRLTAFDIAPDGSLDNRRVWADLGEDYPDGVSADPEGRVWYADVPHQVCRLVAEGGEVVRSVELDRGAFSCAVRDGVLYVATNEWSGAPSNGRNGQLVAVDVSS